jgi:hypothetical protein
MRDRESELRRRVEELEAENAELKRIMGVGHQHEGLRLLGLSEQQANLIGVLLKRDIASCGQLIVAANPTDLDRRYNMTNRSVKVPLHHAKAKLRPMGVEVRNVQGRGYCMPPESKARLMTFINQRQAIQSVA